MRTALLLLFAFAVSAPVQAFVCVPPGGTGVGIPCPNPPLHCPIGIICHAL